MLGGEVYIESHPISDLDSQPTLLTALIAMTLNPTTTNPTDRCRLRPAIRDDHL